MTLVNLAIWNADGTRRLRAASSVHLDGDAASAPRLLVEAARDQLGLRVALLRVGAPDLADVELLGLAHGGLEWRSDQLIPTAGEREVWQRPGWLARVTAQLAELGIDPTGEPEQVRHTTITGLLRVLTRAGWVWWKAGPELFEREGRLTAKLGEIVPGLVPEVIAHGPGWFAMRDFPAASGSTPVVDYAAVLAEIQVAALSHVDSLRALGCPDRPLSAVVDDVARLAGREDLLDAGRRERLAAVLPELGDLRAKVDALGVPSTLVHGDLNSENVRWTDRGWLVYDWTDTCLGLPFLDVELPLSEAGDPRRVARAYAEPWRRVLPAEVVEEALRAAPMLGSAFQAANYQSILDNVDRHAGDDSNWAQMHGLLHFWVDRLAG